MQLRNLIADDDAVSPVIGVILMVAITVILAAVIGTFVLGLGGQVGNNAPSSNVGFDYGESLDTTPNARWVNMSHNGGDPLQESNVKLKIAGTTVSDLSEWSGSGDKVTAGDSFNVANATRGQNDAPSAVSFNDGDDVQLIWQSNEGGDTAIVADGTVSL